MKNLYHSLNKAILACFTLAFAVSAHAQTIPNPSFEADTFTVNPGYISGNGPITGWTANADSRVGLNPAGGSPFADNGVIPNGVNVAFIQSDPAVADGVTLSTTISDLVPGQAYTVNFRVNARAGQEANLSVDIDSTRIVDTSVNAVNSGPYKYFAFNFTASATSQTMTLRNASGGDNTVLVDDFSIAPRNSGWSYAAWTGNADSGVDGTKTYTHAFNLNSTVDAVINGITFTNVPGANPAVAGSFSTANLVNGFPNDGNNLSDSGSRQLANDFVYGNAPTVQGITINGLFPGFEYVATIYSVGFDNPPITRAVTFSVGNDRLTVNQDQFGNDNGIRVSYRYIATGNSITLSYTPLQGATFHTYGFNNYILNAASTPTIGQQPLSQCVGIGQPVTFSVTAAGSEPLSYQWKKDTFDILGANAATYTIPSASPGDAGVYSVVVSNPSDSVTSDDAVLQVGLSINNPSFEADTFTVFPGYVSGNGPITGWNALPGHGINPGGGSPFADNGTIPDGHQVAFMQQDGAMSQMIEGFIPGNDYYIIYYENARSGGIPAIEVKMGDLTIVQPHLRAPVGGVNPYVKVTSESFTAESDILQLSFIKSNPLGGDTTALIDAICVLELPAGTPPSIMTPPQDLIVTVGAPATFTVTPFGSQPFSYQWLKDGNVIAGATSRSYTIPIATKSDEGIYSVKVTNPVDTIESSGAKLTVFEPIPDLYSTGLDNSRTPLANGQTDPHYTLITNPNGGTDAIVEDSTAFPIVGGPWLPDTSLSKWIGPQVNTANSAGGRYVYRTTIDLTDRDPSTVVIIGQWSVDNTGVDIQVNGVSTANPSNPGFNVFTPFAIASSNATFVAGPNTIDFVADNAGAGYCGLLVQILQSNVRVPPGIPPSIIGQPQNRTAIEGDSVSFGVVATGSQPLHYQWLKDDVEITGQTGTTLTLTDVSLSDVGTYTVNVFNDAGHKLSDPATLCINFRRIPGIVFGTGTDNAGSLAATGSVDLHFILSESADPAFPGTDAIVAMDAGFPIGTGPWVADGPKSMWIASMADQGTGNLEGNYTYQTFFDLTGFDLSQIQIAGAWAVDNTGLDILVNGVSTGITSPGFGSMTSFVIKNNLIAGPNVIDFKLNNAPSGANPTGLRVDLDLLVALSPVMTVSQSGTDLTISWSPTQPCQTLQAADLVTGPWTTVSGFKSGDKFDTTTFPQKFFKIVQ